MEWLKKLIEGAKKDVDGNIDIAYLMKQINAEFPKKAVPKPEFNKARKQLKTANATIEAFKKSIYDNETLQNLINEQEKIIQKLQEDAANTTKTFVLKEQLSKFGVLDPDYLIYKQGGLEKFSFDYEGKPIGIEDILESLKEDKTLSHLFRSDKSVQTKLLSEMIITQEKIPLLEISFI